jgi:hypothetical protein
MLMMDSEEKENCLKTIEKDEMRENKRDRGNNNSPAWGHSISTWTR